MRNLDQFLKIITELMIGGSTVDNVETIINVVTSKHDIVTRRVANHRDILRQNESLADRLATLTFDHSCNGKIGNTSTFLRIVSRVAQSPDGNVIRPMKMLNQCGSRNKITWAK